MRDIGVDGFAFDLNIRAYAICILIGIIAAGILTNYRLTRRGAEPGVVLDIIIWAVPLGIVGARVFHVLTHPDDYFFDGANPWAVLFVWEGGIAIFGSLIGGAIGAWIGCRFSGIRFWTFADAVAPALLLAQALGRLGNWFNHELFGQPTDLPWGLEIESTNPAYPAGLPEGTLFHPTFLYEIIWNLVGFALILIIERKMRLQWGKVLGLYLVWYGLGRSVFESIRIDPSEVFFGLRSNVWAAILAVILGIVIIVVQNRRHPGLEPSPYVAGREWVKPGTGVESNDTYSDIDEPGNEAASPTEELATSEKGAKS
ncbi:prolipoprotein diacylglyceryl transferase [Conyzicola sp.]|uniref:prolipoprotein diacylglyceryl transferase n=1 Tax=Conyzicola sp. TaxID=1969404 RepID=UPI0039896849